jgi:cell pole-organizing protein PopZ
MDEILASIRKIISADSQEGIHSETPSFFTSNESEDILDLTDALPEELGKVLETTIPSEFHLNDLGEWSPPTDKTVYLNETAEKPQNDAYQPSSYGSPTAPSFEEPLLSQATMSEAMQAFHLLNTSEQEKPKSPEPRLPEGMGGQTLENLMKEMLKPLLKEWLDAHLPSVVRSVVTQQVEKIASQTGRKGS